MVFVKKDWKYGRAGRTPVTDDELDRIEAGIEEAHTLVAGKLDLSAGDARYARNTSVKVYPSGRRWAFAGDSITAGAPGPTAGRAYVNLAPTLAGTANVSFTYTGAGVGGNTSAQLLARFDTDVLSATNLGGVHIQIGTNDAGQNVPLATFQANVTAMVAKCKAKGLPVTIGLVPPRRGTGATTATRTLSDLYNTWLRLWAPLNGVKIADTFSALADPTTGDMLATCDSGDGVHPNTEGHYKLAVAVAAAINAVVLPAPSLALAQTNTNLCPNGLMAGAGPIPTSWFEQPGGTGTAPTYSILADTSGTLAAGRWAQMDFDAVAGGTRTLAISCGNAGTAYNIGDEMLLAAKLQIEDVSEYYAAAIAGTANVTLKTVNSSGVNNLVAVQNSVTSPGPVAARFTPPSVGTALLLWLSVTVPTGVHVRVRLGEVSVRNLTAMGGYADFIG